MEGRAAATRGSARPLAPAVKPRLHVGCRHRPAVRKASGFGKVTGRAGSGPGAGLVSGCLPDALDSILPFVRSSAPAAGPEAAGQALVTPSTPSPPSRSPCRCLIRGLHGSSSASSGSRQRSAAPLPAASPVFTSRLPATMCQTPFSSITCRYHSALSLGVRCWVRKSQRTIPKRLAKPNDHSKLSISDHSR